MYTYIARRLILAVFVILLVTISVFLVMRILPGDPIYLLYNSNQVQAFTEEQIAQIRHEAGLDKPLLVQYVNWIGDAIRGDLGVSILHKTSVSQEIVKRLPITIHLGVLAFILGFVVGVPLGVISAVKRGTWIDIVATTLANIGITVPIFWLGVIMIYIFSLKFQVLPVMGYTSPFTDFWLSTKQLIMPVICLAIIPIAGNARQMRSSMLEILGQDYIRTARAKGLTEKVIIMKHALKNSIIPVITLGGMGLSTIVGGYFDRTVFNIPGMGRLAVDAIFTHDYAYVQGVTLVITLAVILGNLLIDISYGWFDPRIRYG